MNAFILSNTQTRFSKYFSHLGGIERHKNAVKGDERTALGMFKSNRRIFYCQDKARFT